MNQKLWGVEDVTNWRNLFFAEMWFSVTAVTVVVGVAVTYFVIWHVIKWMNEDGERKDQ